MLVLLFVIYDLLYDLDIVSINSQIHLFHNYSVKIIRYDINLLEVVSFCILGAAFIKSAQLGPHV